MTLTEFLSVRIAEDEGAAHAMLANFHDSPALDDGPWPSERAFADRFTATRVLAECEAKRRIVERHTDCDDTSFGQPCDDLRDLGAIYADHPDYRPEWRI